MDRVAKYEAIIIAKLKSYVDLWSNNDSPIKTLLIIDKDRKHYQILQVGWRENKQYIHSCLLHIDLIGYKVWIQENRTEILIAEELVEAGIPKTDIVLGLLPPIFRKDSEYATA